MPFTWAIFFTALPAGVVVRRFGYKGGIMIGLTVIMLGAFWFIPATHIGRLGRF